MLKHNLRESRRVVAAGVPGVAAENSPGAPDCAPNCPVLPLRFDEIGAATRLETAVAAKHRADCPLVDTHQADQHQAGRPKQPTKPAACSVHSRDLASFFAARPAKRGSDSTSDSRLGWKSGLGITTRSIPPGSDCRFRVLRRNMRAPCAHGGGFSWVADAASDRRNASRISRF